MRRHRSAISLLEVTIVMLVLGIMAAVTTPRFTSAVQSSQAHAAAIQVASHINYVRRVARSEGRTTTLRFEPSQGAYASTTVDFPDRAGERLDVDLKATYDSSLILSCDLDGATAMTFDLEGIPHVGAQWLQKGVVTITVGNSTQYVVIASGAGIADVNSPEAFDPS